MSEEQIEQEINYMDYNEFRTEGFLQEANRQFFHPLGLAISVIVDKNENVTGLGPIWDYRDDPEGMFYAPEMISEEKLNKIKQLRLSKIEYRRNLPGVDTDDQGIQIK